MTVSSFNPSQQTLQQKWVELRSLHLQEQRLLHGESLFLGGKPQCCQDLWGKLGLSSTGHSSNLVSICFLFFHLNEGMG